MKQQDLKQYLDDWIRQHYPEVGVPDAGFPLGREKLLLYYEHVEVAMLQLKLLDCYPEYLATVRKRRAYLRRLKGEAFKKEQFRSLTSF